MSLTCYQILKLESIKIRKVGGRLLDILQNIDQITGRTDSCVEQQAWGKIKSTIPL